MMKRLFLISLMIVVSVALTTGGWAEEKPIDLIYNNNTPASAPMCQYSKKALDLITERTNGRVIFTMYWGSTLLPDKEAWTGMLAGICDVLHWVASEDYQRLNWGIMNMPFIGWTSMEMGSEISMKLIEKFPAMRDEFQGAEIIAIKMMPPVQIHSINKPIRTPADMKGMKIISTGGIAQFVKSVGGVPADIQVGDMHTALNSGLAEANINHWPVVSVFGTLPLYNYHTNFGNGGIQMLPFGMVVNPDSWKKLPADIRKIFKDTAHEIFVVEGNKIEYDEINKYTNQAKDSGHDITYLTPAEIKAWQDACLPLHKKWIEDIEATGKPAKAVYDEARRLIAEYAKKQK